MTEARKLDELTKPAGTHEDLSSLPALDPNEIAIEPDLREAAAVSTTTELKPLRGQPSRRKGFAGKLAALFALGFLAFAAGVAMASAVVLGMMDSGWVKDAMKGVKESTQHFMQLLH